MFNSIWKYNPETNNGMVSIKVLKKSSDDAYSKAGIHDWQSVAFMT